MRPCDRCGKEFDIFDDYNVANYNIVLDYPNKGQHANVMFLCSECQEELKNWIEKGVTNNGKA